MEAEPTPQPQERQGEPQQPSAVPAPLTSRPQGMLVPLKADPGDVVASSSATAARPVTVDPTLQVFPTVSDPTDQIQQDLKLEMGEESNPSKRHATKGQWQTPPIGHLFPSSNTSTANTSATTTTPGRVTATTTAAPTTIALQELSVPNSSDDYAKALQEAYRRGAEAAALMNRSRPTPPAPAPQAAPAPGGGAATTTTTIGSTTFAFHPMTMTPAPAVVTQGQGHPQVVQQHPGQAQAQTQAQAQQSSVANPLMPIMTTSPPPTMIQGPTQQQQQQTMQVQQQQAGGAPSTTNYGVPTPLPYYNPNATTAQAQPTPVLSSNTPPPQIHHPQQPPQQQQPQTVVHNVVPAPVTSNGRSVSMPDMTAYAAKANDEESKRLKRLARNRASARLRRLRKKNLVESYEGEVGVLETSLAKLRAHRWGVGTDPEALLEALSMDRGQQTITPLQRKELIQNLLRQQQEQVRNVLECQLETYTLGWVARQSEQQGGIVAPPSGTNGEEKEMDLLASELQSVLQLTPDQKKQLQTATEGMEEERRAVQVVDTSLSALLSNEWLMNTGIQECTNQFTGILNPTQLSKFLLWSDANSESIDQLDYVNAPPANSQPSSAPMFVFGMEEGHHGDEGS